MLAAVPTAGSCQQLHHTYTICCLHCCRKHPSCCPSTCRSQLSRSSHCWGRKSNLLARALPLLLQQLLLPLPASNNFNFDSEMLPDICMERAKQHASCQCSPQHTTLKSDTATHLVYKLLLLYDAAAVHTAFSEVSPQFPHWPTAVVYCLRH